MTFGAWFDRTGMTYRQAAGIATVSHATIHHVATGLRSPTLKMLRKLDRLQMPQDVRVSIGQRMIEERQAECEQIAQWMGGQSEGGFIE